MLSQACGPLEVQILRMTTWIDPIQPEHGVVSDDVVAAAAGISPNGPTGGTLQGDQLPIEVNVPSTGVEGQHRQIATAARTAQVHGPMLVADPKLAVFDCIELGQYLYEDVTEFHGLHCSASVRCDNARLLKSELVKKRIGLRNILLSAAPPLHHGERCRQRIHFRQLDVAIAWDIALNSSIRYGILPRHRSCVVGARRHGTSNGAILHGYAHARIYKRNRRRERAVDGIPTRRITFGQLVDADESIVDG